MRRRRPWIIPVPILLAITAVSIAYGVLAELLEFYPLSLPIPGRTFVYHRIGECVALWMIMCIATPWLLHWRKRSPAPNARNWPLVLVPVLIGAWVAAVSFQDTRAVFAFLPQWFRVVTICAPLVMGCMAAGLMWSNFWCFQTLTIQGACHNCGYSLRGNTSKRCPECGLQIDANGVARSRLHVPWFPEVVLFETAELRDAAIRSAPAGTTYWLQYLLGCGFFVAGLHIEQAWGWGLTIAGCAVVAVATLRVRVRIRRSLRRALNESGIPVCMKCGMDLREVPSRECPQCNQVHVPAPARATRQRTIDH